MITESTISRDEYEAVEIECRAALHTAVAKIENVYEFSKRSAEHNPFSAISSRIKTFESATEKCKRKNYSSFRELHDIAGVRIITPFRSDIYAVVEILHRIPGINIFSEKDYVEKPKPNGYSSYHIGAQVEIFSPSTGGTKLVPVEIQIRTKIMDAWATAEHTIKYKNDDPPASAGAELKRGAELLNELEDILERLHQYDTDTDTDAD